MLESDDFLHCLPQLFIILSWLSRLHCPVEGWQALWLCGIELREIEAVTADQSVALLGGKRTGLCHFPTPPSVLRSVDGSDRRTLAPIAVWVSVCVWEIWIILLQRDINYLSTCSVRALIQSHSPAVIIIRRWWWLWRGGGGEADFPTRRVWWFLTVLARRAAHLCLVGTNLRLLFDGNNLCFHILYS